MIFFMIGNTAGLTEAELETEILDILYNKYDIKEITEILCVNSFDPLNRVLESICKKNHIKCDHYGPSLPFKDKIALLIKNSDKVVVFWNTMNDSNRDLKYVIPEALRAEKPIEIFPVLTPTIPPYGEIASEEEDLLMLTEGIPTA